MGELRVLLYMGAALAVVAGLKTCHDRIDAAGYQRAKAEDKAAADQQAERNRDLMRQAEKRYVVQQGARDRFIVTTVKELSDAAAPLADCRVPSDVGVRLNAIRSCALGDSAACGSPDGAVSRP